MYHFEWPIFFLAVLTEVLGTASGLGSSMLFLPAAQYFEAPTTVLVLTSVLHVFANSFRVFLFWDRRLIRPLKSLIVTFILSSGLGALLSTQMNRPAHETALGSLLILFVLFKWTASTRVAHFFHRQRIPILGTAGFLSGWLGTGGAIRAMALNGLDFEKSQYVFASSTIDLGGDFFRSVIYLVNGYLEKEHLPYFAVLAAGAWIGSHLGKRLLGFISQKQFERFTLATIFVMGALLIRGL
jgi:uncharacterized membrane protein YfcA